MAENGTNVVWPQNSFRSFSGEGIPRPESAQSQSNPSPSPLSLSSLKERHDSRSSSASTVTSGADMILGAKVPARWRGCNLGSKTVVVMFSYVCGRYLADFRSDSSQLQPTPESGVSTNPWSEGCLGASDSRTPGFQEPYIYIPGRGRAPLSPICPCVYVFLYFWSSGVKREKRALHPSNGGLLV